MELKYNVAGERRKSLAKRISWFTGEKMQFLGAPTFEYEVGSVRIDRNGTVKIDISEDLNIKELVKWLNNYVSENIVTNSRSNETKKSKEIIS